MSRVTGVRGVAVSAMLFVASSLFAASYTSANTGDWGQASTWSPVGVPGAGDDVTITNSHVITVSDAQSALSVTLDSTTGNKMLVIQTGGFLTVARAIEPAITIAAPTPGSANILRMDGGGLETSNAGISITGGTTAGGLEFTALGGGVKFAGDVVFAGTIANARIHFGASSGLVEIGGDLGSGGTIVNSTSSTIEFNGSGAQTINAYTFHHFEIDKLGGTATLNGPITVNGDFTITQGVLDDGGNQISLNGGGTSNVSIGSPGVLKLGSSATATTFPAPAAVVALNNGSAVVYQAGANQTINTGFAYQRLYLATLGGTVDKTPSGPSLTVNGELNIAKNGANNVTLLLGTGSLDAGGDITGDGTVSVTTGSITIAGNWSNASVLSAGTSTITYDGTSAQNVLGATYHHLIVNKAGGVATLGGNATINGDLTIFSNFDPGANTITFLNDFLGYAAFGAPNATLKFNGTTPGQIFLNDTSTVTVKTLEINNSNGVTVDTLGTTVTSALNLVSGIVTLPAAYLFVDVLAAVNHTSGWISGPLRMGMNATPARRFHVGTSAAYLPVDVDSGSAGIVAIQAVEGLHPSKTGTNLLNRYWSIVAPSNATPLDSVVFNYADTDYSSGTESKFHLARHVSGAWSQPSDVVNETTNTATITNVTGYMGDWVIGQRGSLGAAGVLAITDVNTDVDPSVNTGFPVTVEARYDNGSAANVSAATAVSLSVLTGTGTLGGTTTGTISAGTNSTSISGVTYNVAENGVVLRASRTSGDPLDAGDSSPFNVVAAPSTITVTSLADSGAGTLRAAITAANTGGCSSPCTIDFSVAGEINLSTPLPAITTSNLTIDGYSSPGSSANTAAFGFPSNAVITMAINGGGTVNVGFDIQETFVNIKGFAIKNFTNAGVVFQGDNSGSNVSGCYIGTTTSGMVAAPNAIGVLFSGSAEASVGGFTPAARNLISGNTTSGIETAAAANTIGIYGNYVGVKADLTTQLPNNTGIKVCSGCSSIVVGASSAGNIISGNTGSGLVLAGGGTTVKKNYIGTAGSANAAIPNSTGIQIDAGANFNTIGGPSPSDTNTISGNSQNGILINSDDNTIDNNVIGVSPDGTSALGNSGSGIRLENNAARNLIGTTFGNKIAFNGNDGVTVATTATGIGNVIRRGKNAGNVNRAIDLADNGLTANDPTDSDTGPNNLQNFPTINSAVYSGGTLSVNASLNSSSGVSVSGVIIDVYKAVSGQAELYLGSSGCLGGNNFSGVVFNIPTGSVNVGDNVVATATAYSDACVTPSEGTSELSAAAAVDGDIHWIAGSGNWETASNWSPAVVPGLNDTAIIDNGGTYTVSVNSNVSIGSLQLGAATGTQTLQVNAFQSLTLASASVVLANGILTFDGSSMGGSGALSVSGTMNWSTGTLTGAGGFSILTGGTLNINGGSAKTLNGPNITIANGGTANWTGGTINVANGGSFDNAGTFEITTDATIADSGFAGTFDNTGTFVKKNTAGSTSFSNLTFNHNAGTVDVQSGILNLAGGSAAAPMAVSGGAEILIDGNTFTLAAGAGVTGLGKIHINGGTLAVTGPSVAIEHLLLASGTLGGTGTATTSGSATWVWSGGTMGGGGTTTVLGGTTLQISTASAKSLNNRTLNIQNSGTLTISGSGGISLSNGGTISNAGLVDNTVDLTISDAGSDGGITNSGLWKKSGGTGSTSISGIDFTSTGTLKVLSGTFNPANVLNSGPLEITGATLLIDESTFTLNAGSDVHGTGLLRIAGGTLAVNTADALPNVQIDSGFLSGTATHDVQTLTWNSGSLAGTGTTTIPNTATVTFAGASAKGLQRTLSIANGGTATVTGSGSINLSGGGNIANAGLFDTTVDVQIGDAGGDGGFSNSGTLRKSGGAGSTTFANVDLTSGGTIEVQTGTLNPGNITSTGTIDIAGTLLIDESTVTLNGGDVTGTGLLRINGGTLAANAADTFPNVQMDLGTLNGSANVSISSLLWNGGTMSGTGTTTIPSAATATFAGAGAKTLQRTLSIQNGGTMNVTGSGAINFSSGGNIANDGLIDVTVPVAFNDSSFGGDINNTRTFRSNVTGATTLANITLNNTGASALVDIVSGQLDLADGTSSGAFAIAAGADLRIDSHTYTFAAGTTVTGGGTINLTAGTLAVTGNVSIPALAQSGGTLDGSGVATLTGTCSWSAGTMTGGGTTTVGSGGTLSLTSASAKTLNNRTLSTAIGGTINVSGTGTVNVSGGGNIANAGNFNVTADNAFTDSGFAGNFVNTGTFTKSVATGATTFSGIAFTNNGGLVDLQRGILTVNNDPFTQSSGTLKIRLNGTTPGSDFGQITTNATPSLAGTLEIALVGLYQPVGGNTFRVISASSRTGDFTQPYTYPALANGRTFSDAWDASGLLLTVSGNGDLSITKNAPSNVLVGGAISYTINVSNAGPDAANSVSVTDVLQTGHSGVSASGTGWTCNVVGLTVTCTAASLPTGAAPAITINATAPTSPQTFTNVANVNSGNDPDSTNNSASAVVTVDPLQADLDVSASGPGGPVAPSSNIQFDFEVQNDGPQTASNVVFSAAIPGTLTFNSATPGSGTCNFTAPNVTCNLGSILNGTTVHVILDLTTTSAAGTHSVTGSATATEVDPLPSNNSITQSIGVTGSTVTVTNVNDSGMGSLRAALDDAAGGVCTPLPCTITFNIGAAPYVIQPLTDLPSVASQVLVDGTSQPGYPANRVQIDGAANSLFAGLAISGNNSAVSGLSITGAVTGIDVDGNNNGIKGNYIGLTPAGTIAANGAGLQVSGNGNIIGGTTPAERNVISGNTGSGIFFVGTATGNSVIGNFIGTDPAGTAARANNIGVSVTDNADATVIGGATTAHANVISGNTNWGVYIAGSGNPVAAAGVSANAAADGIIDNTQILGNFIGPNANGTAALGALTTGLSVSDYANGTLVQDNAISGHANGITLDSANVVGTNISTNLIGVAPDGVTPMTNSQAGVVIAAGVGSTFEDNHIAHNGGNGVLVLGGNGNVFAGNSMHDNALLGIDLAGDGVDPIDPGDGDSGPNGRQNAPTVSSASLVGGGNVHIAYSIDSSAATPAVGSILIEFYEADGAGEGKTPLGSACVAGNNFSAGATLNATGVAAGDPIVLTATSYGDGSCTTVANGTSEFSNIVNAANCTPPPVTITGPTAMCAGGSVTLNAGAGFTSYSWTDGVSIISTQQSITVSPSAATTYTVTVTNASGCANSDSHSVAVNPLPNVTIAGPASVCAGGSVTLDAGTGFTSYQWSNGATSQTITVSPSSTTTYSVIVTDGNTCQASDSHTVTVTSNPTVTITGPTSVCAGTPVTLDAGPGFASYLWSTGATSQSIVVTPGSTTTYSVTVGDGVCQGSDTHTVAVDPVPPASITPSGPTTFCAGGSVTLTASNGTSWLWNTGATTQSITVTNSGTFSVQVASGSCSATSAPVSVTVNPAPVVNITGPAATCAGAPVTLDAGPGFASYAWSTGATSQTITVSPSSTTNYSVTVANGNGCTASDTHSVTVSTNPTATINAPAGICESTVASASVAAQGGATYVWTVGNGTLVSGQGTNAITFSPGPSGSVTLGVAVSAGSCNSSGSATVPIFARPSAIITAPATAAANQSGLVASVPSQTNATYNWSISNGSIDGGSGTNAITFTAGASGVTTINITVTIGTCSESYVVQVFIDAEEPPPGGNDADLALTKSAPATVQPGGTIVYTIGVTNRGPAAASGIVITDNFPAGTSFVSVNGGPWNCTKLNAGIRCTGVAAAGSSSAITLTVTAPQQSATVINTADLFAATPDPNTANNSASVTTTVIAPPPACAAVPPSLSAPANNASVTSPVAFSWSGVAGATEYELWIANALAGTTTSTNMTEPLGSGTFNWFVVARLAGGCDPLTSAVRTVTVAPASNCPTQAPQLTAPSGAVSSPATFTWTPVPQAIGYRLWIEANGTAPQDAGTTDGATSLTVPLPTGSVVAYVDALFSGCAPARSARVALTVLKPDPCASRAVAAPLTPANNAVVNSSSVEFTWTAANGADGYRVWVSLDGSAPAVLGTTTSDTSLRGTIGRGNVVWWTEALYEGCASTESQPFRFTIPARNDCTQARPDLAAPANNSQTSNASTNFVWSAVPNAVSYELWVAVDNGTPALFGTTDATSLTRIVPPGRIDWHVVAVVDRCGTRESQKFRFTYTPPANCAALLRPTLVEPLAGAEMNAPVGFSWNSVSGATGYSLFVTRDGETSLVATTAQTEVSGVNLAAGHVSWFVRASFGGGCSPLDSEARELEIVPTPQACAVLGAPSVSAPGQISSGVPFLIQWTPVSGATSYQLQLAASPDFSGAQIVTTAGTAHQLVRANNGSAPVAVWARVRAIDARCQPVPAVSPYGAGAAVFILPAAGSEGSAPVGGSSITFTIPLGSELAGQTFTAVPRQPWLSVSPASGVVPAGGIVLTVTANASSLPVGTSLGGVTVTLTSAAAGVGTNTTTTVTPSFSVNLVTPVISDPKSSPPPDALIIPAVAHAGGINSHFQSDVRVSNTSPQLMTYQITFTPSGDSGITQGQQSTFSIEPGRTVALDDVLKSWFGVGNGSAMGTLEIRPLTQSATSISGSPLSGLANFVTFASSRTFNLTSNGTFGQYIPAIPFANFIGRAAEGEAKKILSLQQIAQSSRYRTNLGVVEGSGDPASLIVRVFGANGQYLTDFPINLRGGQHLQLNAFLRNQGIDALSDGRVEVEVVGGGGKVTAYASVLDNQTSDPLLVTPVAVDEVGASKWVVPGVADLQSGFANWQTDMRLFNAGTEAVQATLSFYSQSGAEPKVKSLTIGAGQVLQFDRTLASLFETTNDGGAVHVATAAPAKLIATARTYNQTGGGTYGQFISAVTPAEAAGVGSRPLQLLQVEETDRFRSNIGFAEVTGKPVRIEISVVPPDAKFTAVTELELKPNEFRQLGSLLKSMGLADTYNARVTVRAVEGEGRVTAYASVIDMLTNDPTYMPAQ